MNWGEKLSKTTKTGEKLKNKTKRKEINKFGKQNKTKQKNNSLARRGNGLFAKRISL